MIKVIEVTVTLIDQVRDPMESWNAQGSNAIIARWVDIGDIFWELTFFFPLCQTSQTFPISEGSRLQVAFFPYIFHIIT
jgi:hypothetical protein